LDYKKNIILYKSGVRGEIPNLDIWWRGERNGNLMAILAHIINRSRGDQKEALYNIRVIRILDENDNGEIAEKEMKKLFVNARIAGDIKILHHNNEDFLDNVKSVSGNSALIMMGLPGNYTDKANRALFKINEFFFTKEIKRYETLPTILFVKSNSILDLVED
jgi:hypothetical protein